jgi:hypothetical protein
MIPIEQWCSGPKVRTYHCIHCLTGWTIESLWELSSTKENGFGSGEFTGNLGFSHHPTNVFPSNSSSNLPQMKAMDPGIESRQSDLFGLPADFQLRSRTCFLWSTGFFSGDPTANLELSPARCRGKSWLASPEQFHTESLATHRFLNSPWAYLSN